MIVAPPHGDLLHYHDDGYTAGCHPDNGYDGYITHPRDGYTADCYPADGYQGYTTSVTVLHHPGDSYTTLVTVTHADCDPAAGYTAGRYATDELIANGYATDGHTAYGYTSNRYTGGRLQHPGDRYTTPMMDTPPR